MTGCLVLLCWGKFQGMKKVKMNWNLKGTENVMLAVLKEPSGIHLHMQDKPTDNHPLCVDVFLNWKKDQCDNYTYNTAFLVSLHASSNHNNWSYKNNALSLCSSQNNNNNNINRCLFEHCIPLCLWYMSDAHYIAVSLSFAVFSMHTHTHSVLAWRASISACDRFRVGRSKD